VWHSVVLAEYIMKETQPVNGQLNYSDYDGSYMFQLGKVVHQKCKKEDFWWLFYIADLRLQTDSSLVHISVIHSLIKTTLRSRKV
jgi:hypothetical protein